MALRTPLLHDTVKMWDTREVVKAIVLGSQGMLGSDLLAELNARGWETVAPKLEEMDLTDPSQVAKLSTAPYDASDYCFNCAAYTAVDKAETEREAAYAVNVLAPAYVARVLPKTSRMVHISTDFVFDGEKFGSYTEDDRPNPLGWYGQTKWEGEEAVLQNAPNSLVCRTAWLFGPNGPSFPRTMIRAFLAGKSLKVVSDQFGCPTYTQDLARTLVDLAEKNAAPGTYHTTGTEATNWHDFAQRAIRAYLSHTGREETVSIEPIKTEDWPTPTKRPKNSVLDTSRVLKLGVLPMRPVDEALAEFVSRLPDPV